MWSGYCLSASLVCSTGQPNRTQRLRSRMERFWNNPHHRGQRWWGGAKLKSFFILCQLLAHACWCSRVSKCLLQEPLQQPKATSKRSSGQKSRGLNSKLSSGSITFRYKLPAAFRWTFQMAKDYRLLAKLHWEKYLLCRWWNGCFCDDEGPGSENSQGCNNSFHDCRQQLLQR